MKKLVFVIALMLSMGFSFGQTKDFQLSSHILDISTGKPAPDVFIKLEKLNKDNKWETIRTLKTDNNGRVTDFLPYENNKNNNGVYKLTFETKPYFDNSHIDTFYPFIEVVFAIKDEAHYHVPITISPYGYSTYKGN